MRLDIERRTDVVHLQTHTSHVYLVGDEVLKIKKPVLFSFLDYSTMERRRECCEREVALNRRFSPELYLGVVPLFRRGDTLSLTGDGEPVEWAVRMRRLPSDAMMSRRLARGDVEPDEVEALADLLARFYAGAERSEDISRFGSVAQVRENTEENFETTLDFEEAILPALLREFLRDSNQRFLAERASLFEERIRAGRILDGHGDLKPENIFLAPAGPVVTDCIEFNERFRYGDVLADVAYLTMGLRDAGRADLREAFLQRFREVAEPDLPEELLDYYEVYRAVVKGKIEGFRARQAEVPAAEREEAAAIALRHFRLAGRISLKEQPVLVVLAGVSGVGKTTVAEPIVHALDAARAESDRVRKELAGIPAEQRDRSPFGAGIYTPEMSAATYEEMRRRAAAALRDGRSFVMDATHLTRAHRAQSISVGRECAALTVVVGVTASPEMLERHDESRTIAGGASDGRKEIREAQLPLWVSPEANEADVVVHVEAGESVEETRARLARTLGKALAGR